MECGCGACHPDGSSDEWGEVAHHAHTAGVEKAKPAQIPVTVVAVAPAPGSLSDDVAVVQLPASSGHTHADGEHCVACSGQSDVRLQLFNLLEMQKLGFLPAFSKVVVDASLVGNIDQIKDALAGKHPATALRDHEVARRFVLVEG